MLKNKMKRLCAGVLSAAMLFSSTMPVMAAGTQTINGSDAVRSKTVQINARVVSGFTVTLPMAIDLADTGTADEHGVVFASPEYSYDTGTSTASGTYIGVSGAMYGKYLEIVVRDSRVNSPYNTAGHENELALGRATYSSGTYTVANEDYDVYADVNLDAHKFYPASATSLPADAVNIVPGTANEVDRLYPLDIRTKSEVTIDGTTLYYGQITFTCTVHDI